MLIIHNICYRCKENTFLITITNIPSSISGYNRAPDDLISCQWWRKFLAGCSSLEDVGRSGWPCDDVTVHFMHLALKNWCSSTTPVLIISETTKRNKVTQKCHKVVCVFLNDLENIEYYFWIDPRISVNSFATLPPSYKFEFVYLQRVLV